MLTSWIKSPIPYAGCKFDMLDELESVIGSGETLVDMFTGSGVVGANMAPRFERVLCIDVLADLIAMHDNFKRDDPDAIIEKMRGGGSIFQGTQEIPGTPGRVQRPRRRERQGIPGPRRTWVQVLRPAPVLHQQPGQVQPVRGFQPNMREAGAVGNQGRGNPAVVPAPAGISRPHHVHGPAVLETGRTRWCSPKVGARDHNLRRPALFKHAGRVQHRVEHGGRRPPRVLDPGERPGVPLGHQFLSQGRGVVQVRLAHQVVGAVPGPGNRPHVQGGQENQEPGHTGTRHVERIASKKNVRNM